MNIDKINTETENKMEDIQKIELKQPDEQGSIHIRGHIKIHDPDGRSVY
jgi:hypothetical protein